MNHASTTAFRENRARFTLAELEPYADKWVALSADGRRIVASAETISAVLGQLAEAKVSLQDIVLDHIVIDSNDIYLGAAELW